MHREWRERVPRHPAKHHGTCVTHVPWCMSGSLTHGGGKTFPAFPVHSQLTFLRSWQEAHCNAKMFGQCGIQERIFLGVPITNKIGSLLQINSYLLDSFVGSPLNNYTVKYTHIKSISVIVRNKAEMAFQTLEKATLLYMIIYARAVGKHPVVINTENRFTVIGKLSDWQSH